MKHLATLSFSTLLLMTAISAVWAGHTIGSQAPVWWQNNPLLGVLFVPFALLPLMPVGYFAGAATKWAVAKIVTK